MSKSDQAVAKMDRDAINRLEVWLARETGGRAQVRDLRQLSGGAIQENWWLRLDIEGGARAGAYDLVLRKDAPSAVAVSHGRAEEFAILTAAHAANVAVPTPFLLCAETNVLGSPFFLMAKAPGHAAGHKLSKAEENPQLAEALGRNMARIHAIAPRPELAFVPEPDGPPALSLVAEHRRYLDDLPDPYPAIEWGLTWLEENAPHATTTVFCHRDFRTGNYMVDDERLCAILDWEFAAWSDPMEDIGWFTAKCWRFAAPDREAGGIGALEDFLKGYEQESGRAIDRDLLPYWQVMAHMRWAVIALQQADRFVRGGERNLELALTAHIVPELEKEILRATAPADALAPISSDMALVPSPTLDALLDMARDVLRTDVVNALDGDAKYQALMAANAMAIVARHIQSLTITSTDMAARRDLAKKCRSGAARAEDHAQLCGENLATLAVSNPRALK